MPVAPESLACLSCVPSCAPSIAPTMMTLAPLVTMALIWFCCSDTPPLANWTSGLNPAPLRPSLNSFSARTQFSLVFCGRATPIIESLGNASPPAVLLLEPLSERPQAVSASAAMAATAAAFPALPNIRISWFTFCVVGWSKSGGNRSGFLGDDLFGGCGFIRFYVVVALEIPHQQAGDGTLALDLVVDVEGNSDQQYQALDDLGEVGAYAQELEAVVQHTHHQA